MSEQELHDEENEFISEEALAEIEEGEERPEEYELDMAVVNVVGETVADEMAVWGFGTPERIAEAEDEDLVSVPGVGPAKLEALRVAFGGGIEPVAVKVKARKGAVSKLVAEIVNLEEDRRLLKSKPKDELEDKAFSQLKGHIAATKQKLYDAGLTEAEIEFLARELRDEVLAERG